MLGQPQRADGGPHGGGVRPQPQPAVEVHSEFTIVGDLTAHGHAADFGHGEKDCVKVEAFTSSGARPELQTLPPVDRGRTAA